MIPHVSNASSLPYVDYHFTVVSVDKAILCRKLVLVRCHLMITELSFWSFPKANYIIGLHCFNTQLNMSEEIFLKQIADVSLGVFICPWMYSYLTNNEENPAKGDVCMALWLLPLCTISSIRSMLWWMAQGWEQGWPC